MIPELTVFAENVRLWEIIFLGLFLFIFLVRLITDLLFTGRLAFHKQEKNNGKVPGEKISFILTVRNEEKDLDENLPRLLTQIAEQGEIIAVDDFSQDLTFTILGKIREQFPGLKISSLNQETKYSVKVSQNVALKAASHEWIVVLSPHLKNLPGKWIGLFNRHLTEGKNMVAAYSTIASGKGLHLLLYRLEAFFQQIQSYSYILNGIGFVVKEDNIAFRKSVYFNTGGYGKKIREPYANLELILNESIKKKETVLLLEPDAVIRREDTVMPGDLAELIEKFKRIKRHLPLSRKFVLMADNFISLTWLLFALAAFVYFGELRLLIALVIVIKFMIRAGLLRKVQKRLNEQRLFVPSLIYDQLMIFIHLFSKKTVTGVEKKRR